MTVRVDRPLARQVNRWERDSYSRWLLISDSIILLSSVLAAHFLRFGPNNPQVLVVPTDSLQIEVSYATLSVLLTACWLLTLSVIDARDLRVIGVGATEFKRLIQGSFWTFGLLGIISLTLRADVARGYIAIAFLLGLTALIVSRWCWRKWLHNKRSEGHYLHRAIVVGERDKAQHVAAEICRDAYLGYAIVGAVTTSEGESDNLLGTIRHPQPGQTSNLIGLVDELEADTLVLVSMDSISPGELRHIGWALDERGVELIVAPALTDIAGPRIRTRPVSGLPLIYIEYPELTGIKYWAKRSFDIVASALLMLVAAPLILGIAACVKSSSPGPCLFTQVRVGRHGEPFRMFKFRSMVQDAEDQVLNLQAWSEGNGVLFKMKDDPRVTRVGAFLRRYSFDELPQLVNVLRGEMSLVGPRPPLPGEVATYESWVHRRLLVKPGMTGLWQVSGRSDLSWEDSIRLDLYYVENWSMTADLVLLWKTARAVFRGEGAY